MKKSHLVGALIALVLLPASLLANPIPLPRPASMPLEEMNIVIGNDRHVAFDGNFIFDLIPTSVTKMQFPLPPINPSDVHVLRNGVAIPWRMVSDTYPVVLPEFQSLPMIQWNGPFAQNGARFTVDYEHDLFQRGTDWVFFYALGTGKYFPTYEKITRAIFDITLPTTMVLKSIMLDTTPVNPNFYRQNGTHLTMTLTSDFGPFTKDLQLIMGIAEPASFWLLGLGLLGMVVVMTRAQSS